MTDLKWDRRFLEHAARTATYSKDPSTKVGAVLVRDKHAFVDGYNGFPPGVRDLASRLENREEKLPRTVHAEMALLMFCARKGIATEGAELYVTHPSCCRCMPHIISAGLIRVVFPANPEFVRSRPDMRFDLSLEMAAEAGIEISIIAPPKWDAAATEACK